MILVSVRFDFDFFLWRREDFDSTGGSDVLARRSHIYSRS